MITSLYVAVTGGSSTAGVARARGRRGDERGRGGAPGVVAVAAVALVFPPAVVAARVARERYLDRVTVHLLVVKGGNHYAPPTSIASPPPSAAAASASVSMSSSYATGRCI